MLPPALTTSTAKLTGPKPKESRLIQAELPTLGDEPEPVAMVPTVTGALKVVLLTREVTLL